ncbi:ATP synthase assembly factor fmc1 mitochondrial [Clonorchis sinensis]|uniref:Protein FMC1 homolog n=1 Tax=Clonorchis sinensis TaxID=79923 RepID=A0A8T1M9N9_CLOSI|nr:ATP synthase assembly factor fmc1 mitochondrial [Clonorchis sinensis]
MPQAASGRQLLRGILREVKHSYNGQMAFTKTPVVRYILDEFRHNQMTDAQNCAREHEARLLAETYLDYLTNVKEHLRLIEKYKSKEKTTEEAAGLVGLELPGKGGAEDPKA